MPSACVPLADGVEEMEAVIVVDVLRRARWDVCTVAVDEQVVTASRQVRLVADQVWAAIDPAGYDWWIIPGGLPGTKRLLVEERLLEVLRAHDAHGKGLAAICAGPLVLQAAGCLAGRTFTSHPSVADQFQGLQRVDRRVVVEGNLVTSQGPGTSFEFALALVAAAGGAGLVKELQHAMRCVVPE
jgi:protein deglycase